jgi:hypothetical protein
MALLVEAGLVNEQTVMVTTVHPLQVEDAPLRETEHDSASIRSSCRTR